MKKGIILFDIDYVLINTDKLRPFLINNDWKKAKLPYKKSVYPEVIKILEKIKKEYMLGIFSENNNLDYQEDKFTKSGLKKYFDKDLVFIVKSKKDSIQLIKLMINKKNILINNKEAISHLRKNGLINKIYNSFRNK